MRLTALAAVLLLASAAAQPAVAPAFAQLAKPSPKGDWTGDLVTPELTCNLGIHIDETSPGKFKGAAAASSVPGRRARLPSGHRA
jgi:hypothetical protein